MMLATSKTYGHVDNMLREGDDQSYQFDGEILRRCALVLLGRIISICYIPQIIPQAVRRITHFVMAHEAMKGEWGGRCPWKIFPDYIVWSLALPRKKLVRAARRETFMTICVI